MLDAKQIREATDKAIEESEEFYEEYEDIYDGFESNAPCDNAGFCVGTGCRMFFECHKEG